MTSFDVPQLSPAHTLEEAFLAMHRAARSGILVFAPKGTALPDRPRRPRGGKSYNPGRREGRLRSATRGRERERCIRCDIFLRRVPPAIGPSHPRAESIACMQRHWKALTLFLQAARRAVEGDVSGQYVPILMVNARHERTRLQTFYLNSMHGNP